MAKINARELDPQRYSCIQTEQQELKKQYSSHITMARICPYCQNKLEISDRLFEDISLLKRAPGCVGSLEEKRPQDEIHGGGSEK